MGAVGEVFDWGMGRKRGMVEVEGVRKLGERFPLFPKGCLTIVLGEAGTGKSLVTLEVAARVSMRSGVFPGGLVERRLSDEEIEGLERGEGKEGWPGVAVVCAREDSEEVVKMRLMAAGADLRFVRMWGDVSLVAEEGKVWEGSGREMKFMQRKATLVERLEKLLAQEKGRVGVVVLDPLTAFLEGKDTHGGTVRRLLEPLLRLAERYGFMVVGVMHVKKEVVRGENILHRALGSQGFTGLARSVMVVTRDDEKWERNRRLVVPVKNTFAAVECGYAFEIWEWRMEGEELPAAFVVWEAEGIGHRWVADAVVAGDGEDERYVQREMAKAFLREMLKEGAVVSEVLQAEARRAGIAVRTLTRAKMELGVGSWREAGRWVTGMAGEKG